ncbi:putative sodium/sulfate transporter, DASS family [Crocosphaera subtropica ATCC 51142]|uniref:Sodium/sulfate transporter, DASS family n=1 Tax=Crocosphaera subtropica (strain ATCC 51142 / BH68) TaxID=43989 RepID=B1WZ52_CROS5|nr:SLC13 family permease [Crocosphaera subtropica]ACB49418.1 putative sodium/sulfate transporter, DASS family [Crocosphaera subtropica ATCC 51142]
MEILLTVSIMVMALIAFAFEWLPADLTAISVTVILMLLKLVSPEEGISGFANTATITVMAMFILSAGITRTGVIQVVRDLLMKWGGKNASQQILVMGLIVGPISAFINNTAVVAIFLPIIEAWCKQQKISVSKLLIPLSYVTILGGMLTLIGTSTNILASGVSKQLGYGEFSLFQFTGLGIITFLIGLVYLMIAAPKLLPERIPVKSHLISENYGLKDYVTELIILPSSSLVKQSLRQSGIQRKFDIDVLELIHNDTHFSQPLADKKLSVGDILLVRGSRESLLQIKDERGVEILADFKFSQLEEEITKNEEKVAEVLVLSNSRLIGSTLKDLRFRQRYNATVLAIRRGEELVRERLGKVSIKFGDLLLVQAPKESFIGLQTTRELLVLEERELETLRTHKAWTALAIVFGVILLAALSILPILVSSLMGVILMVMTGCLKPGEIYGAVRWDIIFLLAGLIPLGIAMENSGTTEWLANLLANLGGNFSGYWILTCFYIITSLMTEILSNNASVVLMIPIAAEVAKSLSLNPMAFIFAVTFAASNSFLTPIGYQTNTMVYAPGGYKFSDFIKIGLWLNLLFMIVTPLLITLIYGL